MERFERKTGRFRQVKCEESEPVEGAGIVNHRVKSTHYRIQEQWRIQIGSVYTPPDFGPPDSKTDEFLHAGPEGPLWMPCIEVWRDLPIVSEEEAKKDSV